MKGWIWWNVGLIGKAARKAEAQRRDRSGRRKLELGEESFPHPRIEGEVLELRGIDTRVCFFPLGLLP